MPGDAITFRLNGAEVRLEPRGGEPLLFALRNRLNLKATRFGCGLEQCGACMVIVHGVARYACTLPVSSLQGTIVTTAEGLAHDVVGQALLTAFAAEQAGQCGYCLAGILMSAFTLIKRQPKPTREQIVTALDRHLCRCGAHVGILRAVERAATDADGRAS